MLGGCVLQQTVDISMGTKQLVSSSPGLVPCFVLRRFHARAYQPKQTELKLARSCNFTSRYL
jgi:hypothetical protein